MAESFLTPVWCSSSRGGYLLLTVSVRLILSWKMMRRWTVVVSAKCGVSELKLWWQCDGNVSLHDDRYGRSSCARDLGGFQNNQMIASPLARYYQFIYMSTWQPHHVYNRMQMEGFGPSTVVLEAFLRRDTCCLFFKRICIHQTVISSREGRPRSLKDCPETSCFDVGARNSDGAPYSASR